MGLSIGLPASQLRGRNDEETSRRGCLGLKSHDIASMTGRGVALGFRLVLSAWCSAILKDPVEMTEELEEELHLYMELFDPGYCRSFQRSLGLCSFHRIEQTFLLALGEAVQVFLEPLQNPSGPVFAEEVKAWWAELAFPPTQR